MRIPARRPSTPTVVALLGVLVGAGGVTVAATAGTEPPTQSVVRARAIELVDASGTVRAQLNVEATGEAIFRMRDGDGAIRVKLGTSKDGSGLLLNNSSIAPGVQLLAKDRGTKLLLKEGRRQRVVKPPARRR